VFDNHDPDLIRLPLLDAGEFARVPEGAESAWILQRCYVLWRKQRGLDPPADVLNRWQQAMERIGEDHQAAAAAFQAPSNDCL